MDTKFSYLSISTFIEFTSIHDVNKVLVVNPAVHAHTFTQ